LFSEHPDYLRVFEYLESRPNFYYLNVSKPGEPPSRTDYEALQEALQSQIATAEIVVVPATVFHKNPVLVTFQITAARTASKPVLGIKSFGDTMEMPRTLLDRADDIVDWNARAICDGIRRLARHENTAQWETIEFKLD
jgi:hypothetical protein